ncbi:hypothetical protein, partial [Klebsiella pneumoniae]
MMSLWDALRMNMMISYQELVRTFLSTSTSFVPYNDPIVTNDFIMAGWLLAHLLTTIDLRISDVFLAICHN